MRDDEHALTVSYATQNGTAASGTDYTAATGTVTFAGGSLSGSTRSIAITIATDTIDEANETFSVSLSNPQGGVLGTITQHTVTILDDDDPPVNQPPTVAWSSPAAGASFTSPATIQLSATASDPNGTISYVDFYAGGTLLQRDTSSPYSYSWTNVGEGTYTLSAIATDNAGASTTATRTITVVASGDPYLLMADDFNDNVLDAAKWNSTLFSGTTQDTTIPVAESGQRLNIGPLRANTTGVHYNGITSSNAYNFTGAAAYAELVQPSSYSAAAEAMLTVGKDSSNYYRLFVSGTTLTAQKEIAGVKNNVEIPYDPQAHRYLRIRHDSVTGQVLWETAPSGGALPGAWTIRRQEAWNTAAVPLTTIRFELKAGTSAPQPDPGTVIFDNFKAYRTGGEAPLETVMYASDVAAPQGVWQLVADPSAAGGAKLTTANQGVLTTPALAAPASFFDVSFNASAGVRYRLWLRLRASGNSTANDSVWVQFSDSLNQLGQTVYRIGSSSALAVNLENCTGCGVSGWGWQTNSYAASDTGEVWFATSGSHTLRVQVREDGVELDQIVLSAAEYVDMAPGPAIADATIVPRADGNLRPTVSLTAPAAGATFTAPASIALSATAADADGITRVDFYANGAPVGQAITSPYNATWANVTAGTYNVTAVAVDTRGATTSTPARTVTVYASGTIETILLTNDFNDNTLDTAKWDTTLLFSGFKDSAISVTETGGQIRIGPLLSNASGSHYNGIESQNVYNFSGAAASVELVQPASTGVAAYAMLTVGKDVDNFYRLFVSGTTLVAQRKIAGTKNDVSLSYDAAAHRFLRIRHNATTGEVLWETAPSVGGLPGTWIVRRQEAWNTSAVPLTLIRFELKAGTSDPQPSPGTVIFDNFKASRGGHDDTVLLWEDLMNPRLKARDSASTEVD